MFSNEDKKAATIDISSAPMHSPKKGFEDINEYKRSFSKHTKALIKKSAPYKKQNQHFVGFSQPNPETKTITHFLIPTVEIMDSKSNPGINTFTRKKIDESKEETIEIFGVDNVAPVRDIPGEAHKQGKKIAQNKDIYHAEKPSLGWSTYLYNNPTIYTGRSWTNEDIFELHPVALYAFYFDFKKMGYFSFGAYLNQERLRRTIPTDFFAALVQDMQEKIQDILLLEDTEPYKIDDQGVKEYEALWDKIKKDPEKKEIGILMMQTIYNASGLNLQEEIEFIQHQKVSDQTIIQQALSVAIKYGIKLDLEHIPPFFPESKTNHATALLLAAKKGDLKSVTALIEAKANINAIDNNHDNILHYAIKSNNHDMLQYLLSHSKNFDLKINAPNNLGDTALIAAIQHGNTAAVKSLIEAKADAKPNLLGIAPIHYAGRLGNIEIIKLLLKNKTLSPLRSVSHFTTSEDDVPILDKDLNTPLHYFASSCVEALNSDIIELFSKDINTKNDMNLTPLAMALLAKDGEMASLLLERKADITLLPSEVSSNEKIQQFLSKINKP